MENKTVISLSNLKFSRDKISVLERGLNYCPSTRTFDKNKKEISSGYISICPSSQDEGIFFERNCGENFTITTEDNKDSNRIWHNCVHKNPFTYPVEVREVRSQSFLELLAVCQAGIKENVKSNYNNFTTSQRDTL